MAHKAPGKHYREGMSLVEIIRIFPDDAAAERWFTKVRWPDGAYCPHCGSVNVQDGTKHKTMPYRCRDCRKWFSVKTGTVMQSSKLGLQVWAVATYLLTTGLKGQASMKLHRDLGITQKSAWHLAHRIRETWVKKNEPMAGPVEVDETYIGGKDEEQAQREEAAGGTWRRWQDRRCGRQGSGNERRQCKVRTLDHQGHPTGLRRLSRLPWRQPFTPTKPAPIAGCPSTTRRFATASASTSGIRRTSMAWRVSGPCSSGATTT